jgi:formylglycine-generating enzyme required for sulfatase activity
MPRRIETSRGQELALVPPGRFTMGTPRGTRGRRANETPRTVELTRPYYLGVREISNREYREFRSSHHSGAFAGKGLDGDDQPVSGISWDDAARFCNWLSRVDGLPPTYVERAEGLVAAEPMTTGYRLPTEAEWAWAARFDGGAGGTAARLYPWGDAESPPKGAGNYADEAASGILPHTMAGYADGFAVAAPVGSGERNAVGIRDLGGNVAEWVHDLYTIYPPSPSGSVWQNPVGPSQGQSHVIRGASWKDGRLARLRLAYRDYSAQARADVGFRIARSAE